MSDDDLVQLQLKARNTMDNYSQELRRRTAQFTACLKKMHHRAHEEVQGSYFIIFQERLSRKDSDDDELKASVTPSLEFAITGFSDAGLDSVTLTEDYPICDIPTEGWKQDNSSPRFIQCSIEKNWFCLDMPLQTLYRHEAEQIFRCRKGFFFLRDRPQFTLKGEHTEGYDPFRKIFIYGDEDSAAEDMAFVFFQIWKFPVDWRFYVYAAAFGSKKTNWEKGAPLE